MNPKLIKIAAIAGGIVVLWLAVFLISNSSKVEEAAYSLEFWNVFTKSDVMQPLLNDFQENTGIKVNYRNFTDLNEYRKTLLMELAAGEGPDILAVNNQWLPSYKSLLTPLPEDTFGFTKYDLAEIFVDAVAEGVLLEEEIPESDAQLGRIPEKVVYSIPLYVDTLGLYYNKELMRNVLSKPYASPELTWEGIRSDVAQLAATDAEDAEGFNRAGIAMGRVDNITRGLDIIYALYSQFGGEDLSNAGRESGVNEKNSTAKPFTAALDFFTSFSRNPDYEYYTWNRLISADAAEKELDAFARGKVAMVLGYGYQYEEIKSLIQQINKGGKSAMQLDNLAVSTFPQILNPDAGNPKTALANYFGLSVAKNSVYPQAAWQLILYLTGKNAVSEFTEATHHTPSRRDLLQTAMEDEIYGLFAQQAVYATSIYIPDAEKAAEAIAAGVSAIVDEGKSVSSVAQAIANELAE